MVLCVSVNEAVIACKCTCVYIQSSDALRQGYIQRNALSGNFVAV